MVGRAAEADVRDTRAAAGYWRTDYEAIAPRKDANGVVTETDPAILFLSANAGFRASQAATDRGELVRRLDNVVKSYGEVLKPRPARARPTPTRARRGRWTRRSTTSTRSARARRWSRTRAGAAKGGGRRRPRPRRPICRRARRCTAGPAPPPAAVDMNQFKIVIPKTGRRAQGCACAGKGGQKIRKG
jgi:hypothetical protein